TRHGLTDLQQRGLSRSTERGEEMFPAGKAAYTAIIFLLLTPWISGPRPTRLISAADLNNEVPGAAFPGNVDQMQHTLQDKGHYRGKVDGVLGLRTRAGIRSYQKAENLPVTGQLDTRTAGKLGVTPETLGEMGEEAASQDKPSAGIKRTKGSQRTSKAARSAPKKIAAPAEK
ncbi:MAG TPA: peptidoglycan-binding domain-containing protein, partial [Terriglobales bacterium]|nr:peptidoglycan-binding domain-containing protein [Terriglobales bacterium]